MLTSAPARGYADDVAFPEGRIGVGNEVRLVDCEVLQDESISNYKGYVYSKGEGKSRYLSEEGIVYLLCGAYFDCFHHFAGGDDGAAEGLGSGRHCCVGG